MTRSSLISLLVALLVLVGVLGAYLFWYFMIERMSSRTVELATLLEAKHQEAREAQSAQKTADALHAENIVFDSYFISDSTVVPFLEQLERTVRALGADVEVVSVAREAGDARPRVTVNLILLGSFGEVVRALGVLEHAPYDIVTSQVTLSRAGATDVEGGATWSAAVTFSVGMKDAGVTPGAASPSIPSSSDELI